MQPWGKWFAFDDLPSGAVASTYESPMHNILSTRPHPFEQVCNSAAWKVTHQSGAYDKIALKMDPRLFPPDAILLLSPECVGMVLVAEAEGLGYARGCGEGRSWRG